MQGSNQVIEILQGPKNRINVSEVRDVIAKVSHGTLVYGRQPKSLNANVHKIIKPRFNA